MVKKKEDTNKKAVTPTPVKDIKDAENLTPVIERTFVPPPSYGINGREGALESNEVYDEADIASAMEAGFIAQALERHKEKVAPEKHPDFDGENCIDCTAPIPEVRLNMGKIRCVDCQTALEKLQKIQGKY